MAIRYFAAAEIGERSTMREYSAEEHDSGAMFDARGGGGDELGYDPEDDTFSYDIATGGGIPQKRVPNPLPGGPLLEAALLVAAQADEEWK